MFVLYFLACFLPFLTADVRYVANKLPLDGAYKNKVLPTMKKQPLDIKLSSGGGADDIPPDLTSNNEKSRQSQLKALDKYYVEKVNYMQENIGLRWPLGIIPYYFDLQSYDFIISQRLRQAMDEVESASCVHFQPIIVQPSDGNASWIHVTNPTRQRKCMHETNYNAYGEIVLTLGYDCLSSRDVMQALLRTLGFGNEVSHPQRDQYIRIMWENIQPEYRRLFKIDHDKSSSKTIVEYDPMSIMHFHDRAFSRNGQATIVPLMPGLQINPTNKLSQLDKMKLRLLFGHECNKRNVDNFLDKCKTVLHDQAKGGKSNNTIQDSKNKKTNNNELGVEEPDLTKTNAIETHVMEADVMETDVMETDLTETDVTETGVTETYVTEANVNEEEEGDRTDDSGEQVGKEVALE